MEIRTEKTGDRETVHSVNVSAFITSDEADLVDILRDQAESIVSLVAEEKKQVVGHIMFSPVSLSGHPDLKVMGLAPMSVLPAFQQKGIGSALVRSGLEQCRQLGFHAVVVLGHPEYYPRFGFLPSLRFGIDSEYDVPKDVFMVMELSPGALHGKTGKIKYHQAFSNL